MLQTILAKIAEGQVIMYHNLRSITFELLPLKFLFQESFFWTPQCDK